MRPSLPIKSTNLCTAYRDYRDPACTPYSVRSIKCQDGVIPVSFPNDPASMSDSEVYHDGPIRSMMFADREGVDIEG